MDLDKLVDKVKKYEGIQRKHSISKVCTLLQPPTDNILASFGEDCAVIRHKNSDVLLLSCDGIMESLVKKNPRWAGYCSVLVNANDIAAMGGRPLAMVNLISYTHEKILIDLIQGMNGAIRKFDIPMVGGHTHPDANTNSISVSILGIARRNEVLYSHTANIGDSVLIACDLIGRFTPDFAYSWDTTSFKSSKDVRRRLEVMQIIAKRHLATAAKDISMPGALGTLGMLLESSYRGAKINVDKIPIPHGVPLIKWLQAYQGCGFILTCGGKNENKLIREFSRVGLTSVVIGKIIKERKLIVLSGKEEKILFDFKKDIITGIPRCSVVH